MPPNIDLRPQLHTVVLNQGRRPTCVPFAVSAAHEAARSQLPSPPPADTQLAPEAIWWEATRRTTASAAGMTLSAAGDCLRASGQPELTLWPYNDALGSGTEPPPTALASPPWYLASLRSVPLMRDGVEQPLEDCLLAGAPVVLVVGVTDDFMRPGNSGVITQDAALTSVINGYHAVTCVGARNHSRAGRLFLVKNSWGNMWALGGYAWLTMDYMGSHGQDAAAFI